MTTKEQVIKDYERWRAKRDVCSERQCRILLARLCATATDWMFEKIGVTN